MSHLPDILEKTDGEGSRSQKHLKELGHDPRMRISAAKILKGCAKLFKYRRRGKLSLSILSNLDHPGFLDTDIWL